MDPKFIGLGALESIATSYTEEITMSAVYYRPDVFNRLQIDIVKGVQFKNIAYVMARKGHTTRRKKVGDHLQSQVGYLEERKLEGFLSWNRYKDNRDNYVEFPVPVQDADHSAEFSYPLSEIAFKAAVANYGEDVFDCLWYGDVTVDPEDEKKGYLHLYNGFLTYLANDVLEGRISEKRGNLVKLEAIEIPTLNTDASAYNEFVKFRKGWHQNLKNAKEVLVYCSDETGMALRMGFANSTGNHVQVIDLGNGNFRFPLWPNITICPESSMGTGSKLIATTPMNFQYGVDTENSKTKISVQLGSDEDNDDIFFQVQSIQGTRVINVNPTAFCMSDAPMTATPGAGDYTKNTLCVTSNNPTWGTVQVDSTTNDPEKGYAPGTSIQLKATNGTGTFVKWMPSGQTDATITILKKDAPEAYVAIFKGA